MTSPISSASTCELPHRRIVHRSSSRNLTQPVVDGTRSLLVSVLARNDRGRYARWRLLGGKEVSG